MMRSISEIIQVIESKLHVYFEKIEPTKDVQFKAEILYQFGRKAREREIRLYFVVVQIYTRNGGIQGKRVERVTVEESWQHP